MCSEFGVNNDVNLRINLIFIGAFHPKTVDQLYHYTKYCDTCVENLVGSFMLHFSSAQSLSYNSLFLPMNQLCPCLSYHSNTV